MKKDDIIKTLTTHQMGYDTLLGGVVFSPKCAVKVVSTGEHCPETGIHKIDDTDEYLCERCYENWTRPHNNVSGLYEGCLAHSLMFRAKLNGSFCIALVISWLRLVKSET